MATKIKIAFRLFGVLFTLNVDHDDVILKKGTIIVLKGGDVDVDTGQG